MGSLMTVLIMIAMLAMAMAGGDEADPGVSAGASSGAAPEGTPEPSSGGSRGSKGSSPGDGGPSSPQRIARGAVPIMMTPPRRKAAPKATGGVSPGLISSASSSASTPPRVVPVVSRRSASWTHPQYQAGYDDGFRDGRAKPYTCRDMMLGSRLYKRFGPGLGVERELEETEEEVKTEDEVKKEQVKEEEDEETHPTKKKGGRGFGYIL